MARTYAQIRQLTARQTGLLFLTGTVDSTGSSVDILRAAALTRFAEKQLIAHHILLTSGSPTYTELFCTDFFQLDGDAKFRPELGAAPDSLTFEVLPFSGTDFLETIQSAILQLYDDGLLTRNFWLRIVSGSPIYNADFAYWTSSNSVLDGWTATSSSIAHERASANVALAEDSVRLHTSAGHLDLDASYQRYLNDFKGHTVTLHCWVKTAATSNARIALYDGSTINYSAYHGGDGDWELLSLEVTTAETDTEFEPRLYIDKTNEAYFSLPFITGGPIVRNYPVPHQLMPDGPYSIQGARIGIELDSIAAGRGRGTIRQLGQHVSIGGYDFAKHHDENTTTQLALLDFSASRRPPADGLVLMLRGDGPLTVPSSALSTDSIEVTETESLLLASVAAVNLLERAAAGAPNATRSTAAQRIRELSAQIADISLGAGESRDSAVYHVGW